MVKMAVVLAVFLFILLQVNDTTAQSCEIRPNLTVLTLRNPLGRDIEFQCQCINMNGEETRTIWYSGNRRVSRNNSDRPYTTINPSRLIISGPYTDADAGVYTCANTNSLSATSARDMIILNAQADPGGTTTTCTIISTNFPGLTTNGGSIVIGAPNVIIYCICMRGNVAVGPTIWLRGQESLGTTEITSNPYYRDDIPSSLIIPSFTASDADTFHCRSGSAGTTVIEDTITLAIQGCVISPNFDTLLIRANIARPVEFHCQCKDHNGMMIDGTRWILPSGTQAPSQNFTIPPAVLIITSGFSGSDNGTYVCSPNDMSNDPSRDVVELNAAPTSGDGRNCTIDSTSLPIMTDSGVKIVPNEAQVIIYCACILNNVAVGPTRWFFHSEPVTLTETQLTNGSAYYRNNVPAPLIIPSFTASNVGTYSCSSDSSTTSIIQLMLQAQPPTDVKATLLGSRGVQVTWTPSLSSNVTGYLILFTPTASYINGGRIPVSDSNSMSGTLDNLEEGTTYIITVQATASSNVISGSSNKVTVTIPTTVPSLPPQAVMVTSIIPASLMVSWQPPPVIDHNGILTDYVIQYTRVRSSDMMSVNVNSGTTQYIISRLIAFVEYSVTVAAMNDDGAGPISAAMVVTSGEDVPSAPRSLMIVNYTDTTVTISWMPPHSPNGEIIQYRILFDSDGSFTTVNTTADDLSYKATGLMPGNRYRFSVTAVTVVGEGNPSNIVDVSVGLSPPTNVNVPLLTPRSIQVTWTLSLSPEATGYLISYTTTASYISMNDRSGSIPVGNTTSGTLNNLEEGTTYTITVRATDSNNRSSGSSNTVTITTYTAAPSSPPQNVMVTSVIPASLNVSWQPPPAIDQNGMIINYIINYTEVKVDATVSMSFASGTTMIIPGLAAHVNYSVVIAAINVNGTGEFSSPPVVESSGEDTPSSPLSLQIVAVNSTSVTLQWSPPEVKNGTITHYSIQTNVTMIVNISDSNMLMGTVEELIPVTVYTLEVRAHTKAGAGPPNSVNVLTSPSPVPDVAVRNNSIRPSTLTLEWREVDLKNSQLLNYTVFYSPVRGPYGPIIASSRRKRQSARPGELTMNFTEPSGTLTNLHGDVTYRIQVAAIIMLNALVAIGDRSAPTEIATSIGVPSPPQNLSYMSPIGNGGAFNVTLSWRRPDPPNGLITQYNVSYIGTNSQGEIFNDHDIRQADNSSSSIYTWTGLMPGDYEFSVIAFTSRGPGDPAVIPVELATTNSGGSSGDGGSGGAIAGGIIAAIIVVAIIIILIVMVIYWRRRSGESSFTDKLATKSENSGVVPLKDIADGKSAGSYEPEIIGLPSELTAIEGQTFSFPSHVTGKPVPDVYWYLNSRDMTEDDTAVISSNGQLTLTLVNKDHAGEWRCQATNSSGSIETRTRLIVAPGKAKPLPSPQPDRKHKPIPISEFGTHVKMLHESSNQGFKAEYESFFNGEGMSVAVGSAPNNKPKNRFANIVAYDENRVILGPCGPYKDDYVNASPLDGYKHPRCYIAAQAPVAKTLADFWRLIWQEHPPTIVMVTNLKEGEKVKCVQYWPNSIGETQTYGPLNVSLTEEFEFADYVVRTIELKNTQLGNRLHVVTQYHFTAWPDHGVPDYATAILAFHRRLRGTHLDSIGPLLVHCSAGVGRTGTFITIDMALEQIKAEGVVAIYNIVDKLRHQRPHMVQSQEQYMFIHDAILESITCGNTQVSAADLQRVVTKLKQRDPVTKLTGYEQQYKVLEQVSPRLEDQVSNSALKNPDKNRPYHCHPMEKGRVILRKEKSDYINASFLKGYKQDKAFIVAQSPMQNTVRDFWKMIYDRQCASIVMLCEIMEDGREVCTPYWPQTGAFTYGDMTVTNINTAEAKEFTTRVFKINEKGSSNTRQVTQFHYHSWGAHKAPASPAGLLAVIEEVQRVQRSTGNKPIVVHCSNALGRTGSFCAIFTILDRFKVEQVIDVLQTVKLLRIKRPGIVEDLDQYQFLYTVVVRYLQSFDTYSNFQM